MAIIAENVGSCAPSASAEGARGPKTQSRSDAEGEATWRGQAVRLLLAEKTPGLTSFLSADPLRTVSLGHRVDDDESQKEMTL